MSPTPEQLRVITETKQHLLVSAGAGTGKTDTVINHILYLLGVEVGEHRIEEPLVLGDVAAITYTNRAAAALKTKLRERLQQAGLRKEAHEVDVLRIGTIHSFCVSVLREFALRVGGHPGLVVLEDAESAGMALEAVRDSLLDALEGDTIPGLEALYTSRSVPAIESEVLALVGDSDRLRQVAQDADRLGEDERAVVGLAQAARRLLNQRLDETAAIDFDQMIVRTRDLLTDGGVRRALQRRIRVLIVDEFQDVDPVQREIAYLLGEPGSGNGTATRLLIVGDPKQSVYRFRRADVTVWNRVAAEFAGWDDCDVAPLSKNFRSTDGILGFVDATVGKLLATPADGKTHAPHEVPFDPLTVGTDEQEGRDRTVELQVVPPPPGRKRQPVGDIRHAEARMIAERAGELVASGEATWGDMGVLLTGWADLATYESALHAVGAPTYAYRKEGFYSRREIVDLIVALDAIRDPANDLAFFGFLRSPFVALKDETLLAVALGAKPPYWWSREGVSVGDEAEQWQAGCDLLERYAALRDRMPTADLLEQLLYETGYLAYLHLAGPDGAQAVANIRKFLHMARGMHGLSIGDFLRAIRDIREVEDREPDAPLTGQENAVVITSIHSAKGLQWPVVFLCDLVREPPRSGPDIVVWRHEIALRDPGVAKAEQPEKYQSLLAAIAQEEDAERKRLWYVAMTRAKKRLIVSGLPAEVPDKLKTPADHIRSALPQAQLGNGTATTYDSHLGNTFHAVVRELVLDAGTEGGEASTVEVLPVELPALLAPLTVPAGRPRHSASELLAFNRCQRKHWFNYVLGLREPPPAWTKKELLDAITRGNIVHDVLERLQEEEELDALLEDAIERHDEDAPPSGAVAGDKYREHLREEITLVSRHPDYKALADQPTARRELSFLFIAGVHERYEGRCDLAAWEGEEIAILDVKTSQCDATAAKKKAAQYGPQRDVYVAAIEGVSGTQVGRFAFQFSRAGVQLSEDITPQLRADISQRLNDAVGAMGSGDPALTAHPAECKFCGYKRVGWCDGTGPDSSADA